MLQSTFCCYYYVSNTFIHSVNNAALCYEKLPLSRDRNPNPERNFIKLQIPALRSIDIMRLMGNVVYNM